MQNSEKTIKIDPNGVSKIIDNSSELEVKNIENSEASEASKASESMTNWELEPTIADLKADLEFSRQENIYQKNNVEGWLSLRNATGKESGNKTKKINRSKIQPKLIRKHNEWRYPALSEPFLNSDRMYNVNPRTFEDKASSKQNQIVLNYQFDVKINKVSFIDRYVRTTVDEGTCIVRTGWIKEIGKVLVSEPVYSYYPIEDEEHLQILTQATDLYVNEDPSYEELPDDLKASVEYSADNQVAVYAKQTGTKKTHVNKVVKNQPELNIIEVANFFIDPACEGEWEEAQFIINTYESTKSALTKRNIFKNLDQVNWESNRIKSKLGDPDHESTTPQDDSRVDKNKSPVLVYEYWGLFDIHKTGSMVPIAVTWIGDVIIQMIENPFPDKKPPFVIVPYMPILKSSFGEADASLLQDNQRILGAVSRGMIDLLGKSANSQMGYAKGFLDSLNKRRFTSGEDFEYNSNGNPNSEIQLLKYPDIPNSALQISALQNSEAEGLSGVKSFSGGITGESYGKVARGISSAVDAAGQREMSILRRLAEGMKLIGKKIIAMNALYLEDEEVIRITNTEFVKIRREDLAGDFDLIVDISTANVDEAKAQDLGMMLQTMGPDMDPGLSQTILSEIAELKRMPSLAEKIRSYKPEPDPLAQKLQELQIAKLEAEIEYDKSRSSKTLAEAENIALDTELDATGASHERNIETQGAQAKGNRSLEVTKKLLEGQTGSGNIEAAVGFNKITDEADSRNTNLPNDQVLPEQQELPFTDPVQQEQQEQEIIPEQLQQ